MSSVTVRIGSAERTDQDISPAWITDQINARRQAGEPVCVTVRFRLGSGEVGFATKDCGAGGIGRPPTPFEQRLLDLWLRHQLNDASFAPGNVVAFVQQARRLL